MPPLQYNGHMTKIVTVPDPRLRQKSTPVTKMDKAALKLVADLKKTLANHSDPEGVGLSAPQIGVNKRVFVIKKQETSSKKQVATGQLPITNGQWSITAIINPEIISYSTDTNWDHLAADQHYFEGCLSIPGVYGEVTRPWSIKAKYNTIVGAGLVPARNGRPQGSPLQTVTTTLTGYDAIYFQHEYDHLEGVLFTDRVLEQGGKLYKQTKDGEFDEIV